MNIIYLRTSTGEQNPQNQLKDCQSINKHGECTLLEEKQSAWEDSLERRVVFKQVLKLIKAGKVENLFVWDLDRVYRNRQKIIEFFQFCKLYKCRVHSFRQEFLERLHEMPEPFNDAMYDFMLQMLGWQAEEESRKKSERVKAAVVRVDGEKTRSYKGNKWGRKAAIIDTEKVWSLYEEGLSYREIANEIEYKDSRGKLKHPSHVTISKLLNNYNPKTNTSSKNSQSPELSKSAG